MNELLVLASSTTNEEPTSPASTIVGAIALVVAAVIVFLIIFKKKKRNNNFRAKYAEAVVSYINNNKKNEYTVNEIRNALSIESSFDDKTIANVIIELNNAQRLYREFEYFDLRFHAKNSELEDFSERLIIENASNKTIKIGVNKDNKKVVFVVDKLIREFSFNEIISYDVYKQDQQIIHGETKKSKSGAIVGGILFGGAGAIAGAAAGNSKTTQTSQDLIDNFIFYVRTTQFDDPVVTIPLVDKSIETRSKKYLKIVEDSQKLNSVLDYIISVNDKSE